MSKKAPTAQDKEVGMMKRYNALFAKVDADGSNSVDLGEMKKMFKDEGYQLTEEQVDKIYKIVDNNGDGKLSRPEFTRMLYVLDNAKPTEVEKVEFLVADGDYSGSLDANEIMRVLKKLGHEKKLEEVEAAFEKVTGSKAGPLSLQQYEQFLALVGMK